MKASSFRYLWNDLCFESYQDLLEPFHMVNNDSGRLSVILRFFNMLPRYHFQKLGYASLLTLF